jgi:hypothetical protein
MREVAWPRAEQTGVSPERSLDIADRCSRALWNAPEARPLSLSRYNAKWVPLVISSG